MNPELIPVDKAGRLRAGAATRVLVDRTEMKHLAVARRLGWDKTKLSKSLSGTRGLTPDDADNLDALLCEALSDHRPGDLHRLWFLDLPPTETVTDAEEATEATAPTAPPTRETEAPQPVPRSRLLPIAVLLVLAACIAVVLAFTALRSSDTATPSSTTDTPATVEGTSVTANGDTQNGQESPCREPWPGLPEQPRLAEVAQTLLHEAERADFDASNLCLVGEPVQHDEVFWQTVEHQSGQASGGILAFNSDQGPTAVYLNHGQWQSYIRVGGGDGSRSPAIAGLPDGTTTVSDGRYWMGLTGDVLLVGEAEHSTYYWMPAPATEAWEAGGGADGPLGFPTSSPYPADRSLRQDFEFGHLSLDLRTGVLESIEGSPKAVVTESGADLRGTLLSAADGTGWFVGEDQRRWWIPDNVTWSCLGGDTNRSLDQLHGGEVHMLAFGGVATCPASPEMGWPAGFSLDLNQYCSRNVEPHATAQLDGDAWNCVSLDGLTTTPIDAEQACRWQYGPESVASTTPGEPYSWACG